MEFTLCKEFGWTITELYDQPNAKVQKFIQIINQRNTLEKQKQT